MAGPSWLVKYEVLRNIRRLVVAALVGLGLASIIIFTALISLLRGLGEEAGLPTGIFPEGFEWFYIATSPDFFTSLIAIAIGGSLFSSEYEEGTSYILYSKPLRRRDIFVGKFLGGFILIAAITAIYFLLGIGVALAFYGVAKGLHAAPLIMLAAIYSQLLFYSLSYMLSQLLRRSLVAMVVAAGILIVAPAIQSILAMQAGLSGVEGLKPIIYILPTWASSLYIYVALDLLPELRAKTMGMAMVADTAIAALVIAVYFTAASIVTIHSILRADLAGE